jgi:hypothetical protein
LDFKNNLHIRADIYYKGCRPRGISHYPQITLNIFCDTGVSFFSPRTAFLACSSSSMRRVRASNLLIIDEVGYLPINATEGNMFFQLISELQERTAIIITTNKGFEEWTEFLGDAALATAILDRLAYQCDKIPMNGKSYRLENRKSFLEETA